MNELNETLEYIKHQIAELNKTAAECQAKIEALYDIKHKVENLIDRAKK